MSILTRFTKYAQVLSAYRALGSIQGKRNAHWYPDYVPGPVPKTEEERIAAAKKYNLLPEEYECYEENEGYGDYPKLPFDSVDSRDPWYPWDNEELRKNFNEPINVRGINLVPEAYSTGPLPMSHAEGLRMLFTWVGVCTLIFYLLCQVEIINPVCEKQYPAPDVTHYSFDIDVEEAENRAWKKYACRKLRKGEDPRQGETRMEDIKL